LGQISKVELQMIFFACSYGLTILLMKEIRRSPVEVGSLSRRGFYLGGGAGFLPSTVVCHLGAFLVLE